MLNIKLTPAEQERIAYISGGVALAEALKGSIEAHQLDENIGNASAHISEAKSSIPDEDFLQAFIDKLKNMSKTRVTMQDVSKLAEELEQLQSELAGAFEYMHDELRQADGALYQDAVFEPNELTY